MKLTRAAVALALVLATPAFAAKTQHGVLYDCDITNKRDRLYWIADKIAILRRKLGSKV